MTLDECYQQNQGKALLIPGGGAGNEGQCVQWADTVLHDVYGFDYHWGNAIDWWNSPGELLNHFDKITDGSIKKGDFVIFNTLVGSVYGHIDVAMQDGTTASFQGADSNWGGNKTVHLVQHNNSAYVLGSLRLKGGDMADKIDQNTSRILSHGIIARNGVAGRPYSLDGSAGDPWIGGDLTNEFIQSVFDSPEGRQWRDSQDDNSVNGINKRLNSIPGLNAQIDDLKKQLAAKPSGDGFNSTDRATLNWIQSAIAKIFKIT